MKRAIIGILLVCSFVWTAPLSASEKNPTSNPSERVITEKLYVYDPTVAEEGWIFGVGIEGWYVVEERDVVDASGNRIGDSDKEGFLGGAAVYAGKGDATLFLMGRKGAFTYDYKTDVSGTTVDHETDVDRLELELKLRWLFPAFGASLFNRVLLIPYVIGGVNYLIEAMDNHIDTPGYGFASTLSPDQDADRQYMSPLLGAGILLPITSSIGLRGDLVANYSFAEKKWERLNRSDGSATGEDWGYAAHGTLYWALTNHFNIQFGAKIQKLDGGDDVGRTYFSGVYTMLGWTF
jgi:hypothetical protein